MQYATRSYYHVSLTYKENRVVYVDEGFAYISKALYAKKGEARPRAGGVYGASVVRGSGKRSGLYIASNSVF